MSAGAKFNGPGKADKMRKSAIWLIWIIVAAVWIATTQSARHSPLFDSDAYQELLYIQTLEQTAKAGPSPAAVRAGAEAYWTLYPDVAGDRYFGRNGPLGHFGARAHYDRHGRREGRIWPNQ